MNDVQVMFTIDEARALHRSLELVDAITNTLRYDKAVKVPPSIVRDLETAREPFKALREGLDAIMHMEKKA